MKNNGGILHLNQSKEYEEISTLKSLKPWLYK